MGIVGSGGTAEIVSEMGQYRFIDFIVDLDQSERLLILKHLPSLGDIVRRAE